MDRKFERCIYLVIAIAAVVSGVQTDPNLHGNIIIEVIEFGALILFVIEIIIKMMAESAGSTHHFFKDGWNCFDFIIVRTIALYHVLANPL
eukprot:SAG11_NODE_3359_length_2501_cov_1.511657_3_plen_91_part_00